MEKNLFYALQPTQKSFLHTKAAVTATSKENPET